MYKDIVGRIISEGDWYYTLENGEVKAHHYCLGDCGDIRRLEGGNTLLMRHHTKEQAKELLSTFRREEIATIEVKSKVLWHKPTKSWVHFYMMDGLYASTTQKMEEASLFADKTNKEIFECLENAYKEFPNNEKKNFEIRDVEVTFRTKVS